jgi:hypothetical protein
MRDLTRLSAPKLSALYDKLLTASLAVNRQLIAAGYGHERASETQARAQATGDPLACKSVRLQDEFYAVVEESNARKRYHGSLRPIRRR